MTKFPMWGELFPQRKLAYWSMDYPGPYTPGFWVRLIKEQYTTCAYCGEELHWYNETIDHVTPHSRGGNAKAENIVRSCVDCNQLKKDYSLLEFLLMKATGYVPKSQMRERTKTKRRIVQLWKRGELTPEIVQLYKTGHGREIKEACEKSSRRLAQLRRLKRQQDELEQSGSQCEDKERVQR